MLSTTHFDRPVSHNGTKGGQTRWVIPAGRKIVAKSMKVLDLKVNPNQKCKFSALVGSFGCVRRCQLRVASKEVDNYYAQGILPYILSLQENEVQRGINKELFGMGNNVVYDPVSKLLTLDVPVVDSQTVQIPLYVFHDFLNTVGILEESVEIIITWESQMLKFLCPVDPANPPTNMAIDAPFLCYETVNYDVKQPKEFIFKKLIQEELVVPAITTNSTSSEVSLRSNAFTQKTVGRVMMVNQPSSIYTQVPRADAEQLFALFGGYMSIAMMNQVWNLALDGQNILTFKNVNNLATQLGIVSDAFGNGHFSTAAHVNTRKSALKELQGSVLNSYACYSAVELHQMINKDLVLTYRRDTDIMSQSPTLGDELYIQMIGEVGCVYKGQGVVNYL